MPRIGVRQRKTVAVYFAVAIAGLTTCATFWVFFSSASSASDHSSPLGYQLLFGAQVLLLGLAIWLYRTLAKSRLESRTKDRILAHVSHEMRSPLTGMMGMSDLLHETPLNTQQRAMLDSIRSSSSALLMLVDDLRDLTRLRDDRLALVSEPFSLRTEIADAAALVQPTAENKDLLFNLKTELFEDSVVGDRARFRQILINLLSNAVKFTDDGGVEVRAVSKLSQDGLVSVWVAVTDTGVGIPEHRRASVFKEFSQVADSMVLRAQGAGLGTWIAKRLVTLMGGTVNFVSEPGRGTTFWFRVSLPKAPHSVVSTQPGLRSWDAVVAVANAYHPPKEIPQSWVAQPTARAKILLADDSEILRSYVSAVVSKAGHDVVRARNGFEARRHLALDQFDLAIIDVHLGDESGLEIIEDYRRTDSRGATKNFLVLTADASEDVLVRAKNSFVRAVLTKPPMPVDLLEHISRVIDERAPHQHAMPLPIEPRTTI